MRMLWEAPSERVEGQVCAPRPLPELGSKSGVLVEVGVDGARANERLDQLMPGSGRRIDSPEERPDG